MVAVYLVAMFLVWMILKSYIAATGHLGFIAWMAVAFGIAWYLDSKSGAADQSPGPLRRWRNRIREQRR